MIPGGHYVNCSLEGYAPQEQVIEVSAGGVRPVEFALAPTSGDTASTDATTPAVTPGEKPERGSGVPYRKEVLRSRTIALGVGFGITGVAAVVTGIFAARGASALGRERDLRQEGVRLYGYSPCSTPQGKSSSTCSKLAEAVGDRAKANTRANVALGIAGVAGLSSLVLLFVWPKDTGEEVKSLSFAPGAGDTLAGASVSGSF